MGHLSTLYSQEIEATLTIVPELDQKGGLVVMGKTSAPRGLEVELIVTDAYRTTVVGTAHTRVTANGDYKAEGFKDGKKAIKLEPGKYTIMVSIPLGEQTFGVSISKRGGKKLADRMTGHLVSGDEENRFVVNFADFVVGGQPDIARQIKAARTAYDEIIEMEVKDFRLLSEFRQKASEGRHSMRNGLENAPTRYLLKR